MTAFETTEVEADEVPETTESSLGEKVDVVSDLEEIESESRVSVDDVGEESVEGEAATGRVGREGEAIGVTWT